MTQVRLMNAQQYCDFDLEILRSADRYWARVLDSPAGQDSAYFQDPFSATTLAEPLQLLGNEVRQFKLLNVQPTPAISPLDPKSFGKQLYETVFSSNVEQLWRSSLKKAKAEKKGLRLRLRLINVPELATLPWEYLYDPKRRRFLAHSAETPIVRYLEIAEGEEPLRIKLPLRILVVISDPTDVEPRLDVAAEWANLQANLCELQERKLVELEPLEVATLSNLQSRLRQGKAVHILHFIGHGRFEPALQMGGLLLEDAHGCGTFVTAEQFGALLAERPPRLVFLNACEGARSTNSDPFGGTAQFLVQAGVPAVIAMQFAVTDRAAINLGQEFYRALLEGNPVDAALAEARKAIFSAGSSMEWGTPVLFMRTPDGCLFDLRDIAVKPPCPYPGLAPFTAADQDKFYGRTAEIRRALQQLRLHPLLAIIGASGSGKSSLVLAGIEPAIRRSTYFAPGSWQTVVMRPGETPATTLAAHLARRSATASALALPNAGKLLVVIDQLEELFTVSTAAEAERFQADLQQLLAQPNVYVLLTVRADFYAELLAAPLWELVRDHHLTLQPLDSDELRQAIVRPAEKAGVELEPALVERLLADAAGEPGVLPLIQETLVLLWDKVERLALSLDNYADLVGRNEQHTGLQVALARRAEAALTRLPTAQHPLTRRIFLRLVQFGEGRADTRRQQPFSALAAANDDPQVLRKTVEHWVTYRLLMLSGEEKDHNPRVDLTHEALIAGWPTLQKWISARREAEQSRRRLETQAEAWATAGRKAGLLDAIELRAAQDWLTSASANDLGHSQLLTDLVKASQADVRHKRWLRWLGVAVGLVALLLLFLVGLVQLHALRLAQETLREQVRQVANVAQQRLAIDPIFSLDQILARLMPLGTKPYVAEAEFALTQALHASPQRRFQAVAAPPLRAQQVATNTEWLAVGGNSLQLISYDLAQVLPLKGTSSRVDEVQWSPDGRTLLTRDGNDLQLWSDRQSLAIQPFTERPGCMAWRPTQHEVAVCVGARLRLWAYQDKSLLPLHDFAYPLINASWSPDQRWLIAWDQPPVTGTQTLWLWDGQSRSVALTATLSHADRVLRAVAWSPDSQTLVAASLRSPQLRSWHFDQSPPQFQLLEKGAGLAERVKFIDNQRFVLWGKQRPTQIGSVSGEAPQPLGMADEKVQDVVLGPDQKSFLTLLSNGAAHLWESASASRLAVFCCHSKPINSVAWRDENYLATGGKDGAVRIWEISTGSELMALRGHSVLRDQPERLNELRADATVVRWLDPQQLLTYGEDGTLRRWQVFDRQGQPLCAGLDSSATPRCYDFSRRFIGVGTEPPLVNWIDNQTFVASGAHSPAQRFSLITDTVSVLSSGSDLAPQTVWSGDGQHVLTFTNARAVVVRDITSGAAITLTGPITQALAVGPNFLLNPLQEEWRIISPTTGQTLVKLSGSAGVATAAQRAPDGRLATADADGLIQVWDTGTCQLLTNLGPAAGIKERLPIHTLVWSADGQRLLTVGAQAALWDVTQGKLLQLTQNTGHQVHADLTADGSQIALSSNADFWVVDVNSGQATLSNRAHQDAIMGIRWVEGRRWPGPENRWSGCLNRLLGGQACRLPPVRPLLLTWSLDGTARLWDWEHQAEIMRMTEAGPLFAAAVSPDHQHILTAGLNEDGTTVLIRVWQSWHRDPVALLAAAQERVRNNRPAEQ